eukprot:TRINITY_DN38_c0_g1_i1.p1 TRINITY_DN38_c0_g1~~TRINITY_DN38_c0_g1_i1.p1  ORF type:complete len:894 (+),score=276.52 TRINITY_DN38_c0_g1_i1:247-2682(+)
MTDTSTEEREKVSIKRSGEKFQFQAEVSRLMDIIIHSLYSNKDIFLRELISNASDALDKIRFLSLTDKDQLGDGETAKLEIKIKLDSENKILSIRDGGIGMTKEDLVKNLGTIAKSGTSAFLEKMQKGGDLNLIGQFGVGFYSAFLVADFVEVHSKHNEDTQWVWASKADGNFEVYEDVDSEPLGRGTEIKLHLKEEAVEYLQEEKLRGLVKKYSEFINFPISLWTSKEVDVPAEEEEEEAEETVEDTSESDESEETSKDSEDSEEPEETEETEESEGSDKEDTKKTKKETVWDWEVLNDVKAIWLRSPKDVTDEEYEKFYQSIAKDFSSSKPMSWTHFSAEGDVEFKAVLFIPHRAKYDLYDNYYSTNAEVKLYVRRVFISDDFEDLLPKYLNFLKGIIDSDTLPLNVSREMLQQHGSLKTIKKKLVRKVLDMIKKIADEDVEDTKKSDADEGDEERVSGDTEKSGKYEKFWKEFGKSIKLGVIEDSSNRIRLAKLLRFYSSKSGEKLTSLDEYVSRMKDGQKNIYYLTGQSKEQLEKSPFLEKLLKKGYEVLYLTDAVDEYLMQNLSEFDDKKFQNASKEDLKIGGKKEKESEKELKESFKGLLDWWKDELGSTVEGVKVSNRLAETPCVVVTSKYGWSANMERIMSAQALGDSSKQSYMKGKKTLEINPRHPIVKQLKELVEADKEDPKAKEVAKILFDTALLESGFALEDPTSFADRIYSSLKGTLNIDPSAVPDPDDDTEEEAQAEGSKVDIDETTGVVDENELDDEERPMSKVEIIDEPEDGETSSEGVKDFQLPVEGAELKDEL